MSIVEIPIRILIADHQEIFIDGVKSLLSNQGSIEWIELESLSTPLQDAILTCQPNIILIDSNYPDISVIGLADFLKSNYVECKLLVLSSFQNDKFLLEMLASGISAHLFKTCQRQELVDAIFAVQEGNTFYCKQTTHQLHQLIADGTYHPHRKLTPIQLSDKEKLILQLICAEYTSKEIADQLNMNIRTIESYRKSLQEKTGSKNSAGLILYAIRNGIVALKAS
jgi:DNA-binding NarL/FixJ family response regulator